MKNSLQPVGVKLFVALHVLNRATCITLQSVSF